MFTAEHVKGPLMEEVELAYVIAKELKYKYYPKPRSDVLDHLLLLLLMKHLLTDD